MMPAAPAMPMWSTDTFDKTDTKLILYQIGKGQHTANSNVHRAAMPFVRKMACDTFFEKYVPADAGDEVKALFSTDDFSADWKYPLGFVAEQPTEMANVQIEHGMSFTVYHPGGVYNITAVTYDAGRGLASKVKSKFYVEVNFPPEARSVDVEIKRTCIINTFNKANIIFETVANKKDKAEKKILVNEYHCQLALSAPGGWMIEKAKDCRVIPLPNTTEGTATFSKGLVDEMWICGRCYAPRTRGGSCEAACQKTTGGSSSMDFMSVFGRLNEGKNKMPRTF
jgi:hypothetical protein